MLYEYQMKSASKSDASRSIVASTPPPVFRSASGHVFQAATIIGSARKNERTNRFGETPLVFFVPITKQSQPNPDASCHSQVRSISENEGTNPFTTLPRAEPVPQYIPAPLQHRFPRQTCYIFCAEEVDGFDPLTPFELSYRSSVIWNLIVVSRFLTEIRYTTRIRRNNSTSFLTEVECRPRLYQRGFACLESGTQTTQTSTLQRKEPYPNRGANCGACTRAGAQISLDFVKRCSQNVPAQNKANRILVATDAHPASHEPDPQHKPRNPTRTPAQRSQNRRQTCYIYAEGVGGFGPPTPCLLSYRSRVIGKLILVRRFLMEIRCRTSIRRLIEPPFYPRLNCRPRSWKAGFCVSGVRNPSTQTATLQR